LGGSWQEGEAIESRLLSRQIESAQRKVEAMNFDIRKQLLDFDNVMNKQREAIYDLRNDILDGEDVSQQIQDMCSESVEDKAALWCSEKSHPEDWDIKSLALWLERTFGIKMDLESYSDPQALKQEIVQEILKVYHNREDRMGKATMRDLERMILLNMIDNSWKEHLYDLDHLRKGINLRAYAQKDPKIEYQKESFALFEQMMTRIRESTIEYVFKLNLVPVIQPKMPQKMEAEKPEFVLTNAQAGVQTRGDYKTNSNTVGLPAGSVPIGKSVESTSLEDRLLSRKNVPVADLGKIGRNDPCICGSGKKYKKCCGK
jgi:preprotein translocase subunit SecA